MTQHAITAKATRVLSNCYSHSEGPAETDPHRKHADELTAYLECEPGTDEARKKLNEVMETWA